MATPTQVEIGTQGTVAALISREIEHFSELELNQDFGCEKFKLQVTDDASTSEGARTECCPLTIAPKRKKKNGGGRFLPSLCSSMDVAEINHPARTTQES
ncbi:hypothetical protein ACHQM5_003643 [Ranunculus cassubicifolius]